MNKKKYVILCTSEALPYLRILDRPFECWLHLDAPFSAELKHSINLLIEMGCTDISISGDQSEQVHDEVDDILIELDCTHIPTAWYGVIDRNAVWDMLNLSLSGRDAGLVLVCIHSGSIDTALKNVELIALRISQSYH